MEWQYCPVTNSVVVFTHAKQHFNYLANPTVDEKCRKHPNKERYAFTKKSSLNKKISYDLTTPMEVVPDENLSVEKQLPAMAKQPASLVVETIPTLPTMVKLTPMDDVQDPNTSNESELNITTEETVNKNAEIKLSQLAHTSSTAQSSSTTDESIWNFKPNLITYFTLVSQMELPDGWIWSFNQAKHAILCIYTDPLSNGRNLFDSDKCSSFTSISRYSINTQVYWSGVGCFRAATNSPIFQVSSASFVSLSLLQLAV
ncbi:hypothetical protein OUZ56_024607 [Daphnia magna]|uniref:Uncharacterized protein n=1 Tax=Daphnia magna TaxID=35525 RepID=A0ABR0B119_9CRUS|nr:hypothetical protein OUZ56_024607 [Daphnia magna]